MRLLHYSNTGRLHLTDFTGKPLPPYAVLSHRWGNDEVLFEDLVYDGSRGKDDPESKIGYRKIEFCAKQAAQDQLQYFWIDTCCIDKWNRRELSEAINSMFGWYQNAARCYAFLSDVSVSTATEPDQPRPWEESFRASKWFTRGWTLQELIAPVSVEFFSMEGCPLGDRGSLEQLVHEITGIPIKALQGYPLESFSISDRIAWAQTRITTEPEDSAYCLLGMLNVRMPASYGEGRENALKRLYAELEATSNTLSIIPFSQNFHFTGRESQLAELEAKLPGDGRYTTVAITGAGGTGKSQLALELAHRIIKKNKSCSIFWIDAGDMDSLHQAYSGIAQKLDIPGWDNMRSDAKQLVKCYLSEKIAGQWLLVFDNVDDVNMEFTGLSTPSSTSLVDYLPQSELGSILFTTTNGDIAKTLVVQNIIHLQEMTPHSAETMFESYINDSGLTSEKQEMRLLLKELFYFPLAIVQAAAYIKINKTTLKDYRSQLVKQKGKALELRSETSEGRTNNIVTMTVLISLDRIFHNNALAAHYLLLAACFNRKDIGLDLLIADSPHEKEDAIGILDTYVLITRRPADSALDLHRLVHLTIQKWLQDQLWRGKYIELAIVSLLMVFPHDNHESRSKWRRLLPHAKHALSYSPSEPEDEKTMNLVLKCAMTLDNDGRYVEAGELFLRVTKTLKTKLGADHLDTLTCMNNLASAYWKQGRLLEAERLKIQVIKSRKTKLGADHPDTLNSMDNLALIYSEQGRQADAEQLQMQVMKSRRTKLGADHIDTLTSTNNLASIYWQQGQRAEAEQLLIRVMEMSKTQLGADHLDTLTCMNNLASIYGQQDRRAEAEQLQIQVLETRKRKLGLDHPDTLISMSNLAIIWKSQGKDGPATKLMRDCLLRRIRVLGARHPDVLSSIQAIRGWKLRT